MSQRSRAHRDPWRPLEDACPSAARDWPAEPWWARGLCEGWRRSYGAGRLAEAAVSRALRLCGAASFLPGTLRPWARNCISSSFLPFPCFPPSPFLSLLWSCGSKLCSKRSRKARDTSPHPQDNTQSSPVVCLRRGTLPLDLACLHLHLLSPPPTCHRHIVLQQVKHIPMSVSLHLSVFSLKCAPHTQPLGSLLQFHLPLILTRGWGFVRVRHCCGEKTPLNSAGLFLHWDEGSSLVCVSGGGTWLPYWEGSGVCEGRWLLFFRTLHLGFAYLSLRQGVCV